MDLARMLEMCRRDQWGARDLDWSRRPRELSPDEERTIVQLFTDMAAVERLAGALFVEQSRRAEDPVLKEIFLTFVEDEVRHAQVAQMLADFYDVRHLKVYQVNASLTRFAPHFVEAIRAVGDDVANAYITGGELVLDVALLRSINDFVGDAMSDEAMRLINRDESRHIAVDYHMVEYYQSDAYEARLRDEPTATLRERAHAARTLGAMLYHARPFFRDVFFRPMDRIDPTGRRLLEAFKRFQLLGTRPNVGRRPFGRFLRALSDVFNHPVGGPVLGGVATRLAGVEPRFMRRLYSDAEGARARHMAIDDLAREALDAKNQP